MLFRRDIEPHCAYCEYAERVNVNGQGVDAERGNVNGQGVDAERGNDTELKCAKRGKASPEGACKAFRYDPLKRVPPRPAPLRLGKFRESDFSL